MSRQNAHYVNELNVRGIVYSIYLYPHYIFKKKFPDCNAIMDEEAREIHFSEKYRDVATVRHELFHAYVKACFYDYIPNPTAEGLEEIACETFSHFAEEITDNANLIRFELDRVKKERDLKRKEK